MNNEEKILEMLTKLTDTVGKQGEMIGQINGRLDRLEADVSGLKATQSEMQDTLTRVAVTQEGVVLPRIQLALEGHGELSRRMDTLATKEQVEALASDVSIIKEVVSQHSRDISKLKKAQ